MIDALDIHVKGIVQGVGFRPFVYRLAKRYLINGWVLNALDGVHIRAEGESDLVDQFVLELSENAPAAAQVSEIEIREVPIEPFETFEIRFSEDDSAETTFVSPDLATCDQCAKELFDENDRRYRYPFINCTNCGPRFTIIQKLPYDRPNTSMKPFSMCSACQLEYDTPADRRFHAQPNACFECGPHISWSTDCGEHVRWGLTRKESDQIFAEAVRALRGGKILAVKGLGGFHLACDANNANAVADLRERKHRFGKAFAVMVRDVDAARRLCHVSEEEAALLNSAARPIVLLRKLRARDSEGIAGEVDKAADERPIHAEDVARGVADGLPELGIMLPYTPVQMLLMDDFAKGCADDGQVPALVMTSGNMHDEPICTNDEDAYKKLGGIADAFLGNDREILSRFDDSVARVIRAGDAGDAIQMIRRARGYAPTPIAFEVKAAADDALFDKAADELRSDVAENPDDARQDNYADTAHRTKDPSASEEILAAGPEQKNTFTLIRASKANAEDKPPLQEDSEAELIRRAIDAKNTGKIVAEAFVSQHIGDMENAEAFNAWNQTRERMENLFKFSPTSLACDLHPEYITTKWALERAALKKLPLARVQHHHAHIVSVIAENGLPQDQAVCGIAFDGTGYGPDGNIWGGEALIANMSDYERFANFAYVPMPGGAAAIKHPLQMTYGVLWEFDLLDHPAAKGMLDALGASQCEMLEKMIDQGINTPVTSSVGRLFDAASAMLGICTSPTYEGEPAILLEAAIGEEADDADSFSGNSPNRAAEGAYSINVVKNTATAESTAHDTSVVLFDAAPLFKAMLDDMGANVPVPLIARKFHDAFVDAIVAAAQMVNALYGISTVALSGGVFMNRYIIQHAIRKLEQAGSTVAINRELPPNDGCISFGEAVVCLFQK